MARILIVDDQQAIAYAVAALIRSSGHDSVTACGGLDGLRLLDESAFDLVVLDNYMPGMSGLDVLRALGDATPGARVPPVIMFSSANDVEAEALRLGAVAFVSKGHTEALLPTIRRWLPAA